VKRVKAFFWAVLWYLQKLVYGDTYVTGDPSEKVSFRVLYRLAKYFEELDC